MTFGFDKNLQYSPFGSEAIYRVGRELILLKALMLEHLFQRHRSIGFLFVQWLFLVEYRSLLNQIIAEYL